MFEESTQMSTLELAAAGTDVEAARATATELGGRLLVDERAGESLPFRTLLTVVTDDPERLRAAADVGLWVVCRRVLKRRDAEPPRKPAALPGRVALFTMARRPDLTHAEADAHWRDRHTPLALHHHVAMTSYRQLSIVARLDGPDWDGFALCGFDSLEDLRERFYETPEGKRVIREDVARFADPQRSPRRLIATEWVY